MNVYKFWHAVLILLFIACSADPDSEVDSSAKTLPFAGQSPPGLEAKIFAPGIISTSINNRDMAISPDGTEIYFGLMLGESRYTAIARISLRDGMWTEPEVCEFAMNPEWFTLEPSISHDGSKMFFVSDRPDSSEGETEPGDEDIWVMDRLGSEWSKPYNLGEPVNSSDEEYFPSLTNDGTIYFTRQDAGSPRGYIYRSTYENGKYSEPEQLPEEVNSGVSQYNAFIAPDESYIIVPTFGRDDSFGATDYYISFRSSDDVWTPAINMGEKINSDSWQEYSPYVSPNGEYFFFMSGRSPQRDIPEKLNYKFYENMSRSYYNGSTNIFWIDASIIDSLREQAYEE